MCIKSEQILFINEFHFTKELIRDSLNFPFNKKHLASLFIFSIMIGVGFWLRLELLAVSLFSTFVAMCTPFLVRQILKQLCLVRSLKAFNLSLQSPQQISQKVFYEDYFTANQSDEKLAYDQISFIASTTFCLCVGLSSTSILIKKDAFTTGIYDDFVVFLRDKLHDNPKALKGLR